MGERRGAIYAHDRNGGRHGGAGIARQDRIGSPRVQQKGDGLIRYLEFYPGLSVGHQPTGVGHRPESGPRQSSSSISSSWKAESNQGETSPCGGVASLSSPGLGESDSQWPICWHNGHGLVGFLG